MHITRVSFTKQALKEWAIAVHALTQGRTIMLLRKGGIREQHRSFQVPYNKVILYPTYEHQKTHLLKVEYSNQVQSTPSGWHPTKVHILSWAKITDILPLQNTHLIEKLLPHHIWTEEFVKERCQWKPNQPLNILLLQVYRLPKPQTIPFHQSYRGCRSWFELQQEISLDGLIPVLGEQEYKEKVNLIKKVIEIS